MCCRSRSRHTEDSLSVVQCAVAMVYKTLLGSRRKPPAMCVCWNDFHPNSTVAVHCLILIYISLITTFCLHLGHTTAIHNVVGQYTTEFART